MSDETPEDAAVPAPAGNGEPPGGGDDGGGSSGGPSSSRGDLPDPQGSVLSLAQLIGAPIHALVDAEAQSAMATARFIRSVGFVGNGDGMGELGDLQMARFKRRRSNADGSDEEVEVQIPLLSMLPIPALQIKDAELDYTVKIIQTEALPQRQAEINQLMTTKRQGPLGEPPATLRAAFAREQRPGDRRSVDMLLKMKLRIEQADMPAGLAQLLALAGESTGQKAVTATESEEAESEDGTRESKDD